MFKNGILDEILSWKSCPPFTIIISIGNGRYISDIYIFDVAKIPIEQVKRWQFREKYIANEYK